MMRQISEEKSLEVIQKYEFAQSWVKYGQICLSPPKGASLGNLSDTLFKHLYYPQQARKSQKVP